MTMQLILKTDSAVDIKTTMSITEENLEKCLTTVLPAANGDLPNGDILKENVKNGYNKEKIQVKETGQNNTDSELNLESDNSNNIDDISHENKRTTTAVANENENKGSSEQLDDITLEHQAAESLENETDLNDLKQSKDNSEDVCLHVTAEQKETNDNEATTTSAGDMNASNSSSNGPCESVSLEDEHLLLANIENEYDNGSLEAEKNGNNSIEKSHTEVENEEIEPVLNNDTKVNKTVSPEDQDSEELDDNKILNVSDITSIASESDCLPAAQEFTDNSAVAKETEEKNLTNMDVSGSNSIEKENNVIEENETEINKIASAIEDKTLIKEEDAVDIQKDDQPNETDNMVTDFNSSVDDIDAKSTMKVELYSKKDDKEIKEANMSKKLGNVNLDTSENKSVIEECQMEEDIQMAEVKSDDGNVVDLISLNSDKVQIIDDGPAGEKAIEDVNMSIDEPVTEKEVETMDITENSEDDIFNLDEDDKETKDITNKSNLKETEPIEKVDNDKVVINCDGDNEVASVLDKVTLHDPKCDDEVIDLDDTTPNNTTDSKTSGDAVKEQSQVTEARKSKSPILKLSNTLDILSDEEDESKDTNKTSKCINIEDDDDVMLIDEPVNKTRPAEEGKDEPEVEESIPESKSENKDATDEPVTESNQPKVVPEKETALVTDKEEVGITMAPKISEKVEEDKTEMKVNKPLLHDKFLKTCKKSLADMTREEIEEFCIVKIVESILDRSNLNEIRNKLKTMSQNIEEYKKKALMLTKQNRDLQVVLKSIQEDQKKGTESIVPLKITRSVGMQVLMSDKPVQRRRAANPPATRPPRNPHPQSPRPQKPATPQIPVPRLVPANSPALKSPSTPPVNAAKTPSPVPNGVRNPSPVQKGEKRTHNRIQSVTVDLTDDEPPAKVAPRPPAPVPPVRLVPSQNLLAPPRPAVNSPRKVYIPISGPQGQNVRPGQTIMLKTVPTQGPRARCPPPHMVRMPPGVRMNRPQGLRHPAPLPDCMKQYQPPNWKALPPAPDLKLAKVENGIVISWKIEGYQEDSYEEIASYQLYAYQETSSPPNTALWKKIGDVKALPLPMACTLTQFMAGYKYYFAVRAVDIRSRLGPFSLPGSILLLNKM